MPSTSFSFTSSRRFYSRSSRSRRQGSVLVICAVGMLVLLGAAALTVDYSVLLGDRNRLQRACDAGALAGASYLQRSGVLETDRANAISAAVDVAKRNGLTDTEVTPADVQILDNDTKLKITARRVRSLFFIRALGIYSGTVNASATAGTKPLFTPQVVPIGINQETFDAYKNDTSPKDLTLIRPQDTDFVRKAFPTFDPFVLVDYRNAGDNGTHGSPAQMARQLSGEETIPIQIGYSPSSIRSSLGPQIASFEEGIGTIFTRAAAAPWNDPASSTATPAWMTEGTRFAEIFEGTQPRNNPRVVAFFVTDSTPSTNGHNNYPIKAYAPVYIEKVSVVGNTLTMRVRFFEPSSAFNSQPVGLID